MYKIPQNYNKTKIQKPQKQQLQHQTVFTFIGWREGED